MIRGNGIAHVTLSVTNLQKTQQFYEELFQTSFEKDNSHSFSLLKVGIPCWFVQWSQNLVDRFDEKRVGLDHVAFKLKTIPEIEAVIQRLNSMKIANAGLQRFNGKYPYVAFRDPDNIQTEFFIPEEL